MSIQDFLPILQTILATCNVIIIVYGGYKFLNKPHDTLEEKHEALEKRVDAHEVRLDSIDKSLHHGNDKFREQEITNATFQSVMLAFVDFEIAYCLHTDYKFTDDLMKAKKELQDYLSKK